MAILVDIEQDPQVSLKVRRSLDGNVIIFDHEDIDIVLSTTGNKCISFPKEKMNDKAYEAQDRMYNYLASRGIVDKSSIKGGNIHGSLEAAILESKIPGVDSIQACLYIISEYLNQEKPFFRKAADLDDERLDQMLNPAPEDSTELGHVPQSDKKGSHGVTRGPYGFMYNYSLVREHKRKKEE